MKSVLRETQLTKFIGAFREHNITIDTLKSLMKNASQPMYKQLIFEDLGMTIGEFITLNTYISKHFPEEAEQDHSVISKSSTPGVFT
jgi:hypothetical protein